MRIAGVGHALFAATLIGLGLWGLVGGGFAPIWQPPPKGWPAREALAVLTALVALGAGLGLTWRRTAAMAAGVLAAALLVWMLVFKVPAIFTAPGVAAAWESCGETAVLAAAAWALFAADAGRLRLLAGETSAGLARRLYGLAMIAFGAAHLAYVKETAALIPAWLPAHVALVWLTGLAYIAAGLAILCGVLARLAAALSALQMGLFTLLVWLPVVAGGHAGAGDVSEAVLSWALTAAGCVVADSYRGRPWLGVDWRAQNAG
ncbi:MAG TPA: hypothetical protein VGG29_18115 [Caulobacteraceae bacterium]|jgi:hypothetical protein